MRVHRPAPVAVGRQAQQAPHVGQRFGRTVQVAQADHAVDAEHAEEPRIVELPAALQPFLDVAERLVIVAELDQLVRQVAVQHHVEALAAAGAGLAQRLVHVGEGLLRFAQLRIAAGDGGEQQAAPVALEDAQPLVAQRQHALQCGGKGALAPVAARQADLCQQLAGAVRLQRKAALRRLQIGDGLLRRAVHRVEAARQPGPALRRDVRRSALSRPARRWRCRPAITNTQPPGCARRSDDDGRSGLLPDTCGPLSASRRDRASHLGEDATLDAPPPPPRSADDADDAAGAATGSGPPDD